MIPQALTLATLFLASFSFAQSNIKFVEDVDPFTDENNSRVVVLANEQAPFGRTNGLYWRCDGNSGYELFLGNDEYLGGDQVPVIYRFDGGEAITARWNESTTGTSAFAYSSQRDLFTEQARRASEITFGVSDYRGNRYAYTFQVTGLQNALERLGCIPSEIFEDSLESIVKTRPIAETYRIVRAAIEGMSFTEDVNVIYLDGLTVRFEALPNEATLLTFEGENLQLYKKIADFTFSYR